MTLDGASARSAMMRMRPGTTSFDHGFRSDLALPFDDSCRARLCAVRVREETAAMAAPGRGHSADGLSVLHADRRSPFRCRGADLRRVVVRGAAGVVTAHGCSVRL